ncbi:MAG: hypothetical protein MK066_06425 [Crocinitomicaceae bacterium]|nr:hypothetical protein [Crocinitomicaceae bacterium]
MRIPPPFLLIILFFGLYAFTPSSGSLEERKTELKEIAQKLANDDDNNSFLQSLRPTKSDLKTIFNPDAVETIWKYSENMYSTIPKNAIQPNMKQTEIHVYSALSKDIKDGLTHQLPGGYTRISQRYKDDVIIYGLKYTEPNKPSGYSLNSFYYLEDHWICIPKTFRAFTRN